MNRGILIYAILIAILVALAGGGVWALWHRWW